MTGFAVKGFSQMMSSLEKMRDDIPKALDKAIFKEAHAIFRKSQRLVPVENGFLKGSGVVEGPVNHEMLIGYGGPAASYALFVHEGGEKKWSEPGKIAKFLETPVMEAIPGFEERIAKECEKQAEGDAPKGDGGWADTVAKLDAQGGVD